MATTLLWLFVIDLGFVLGAGAYEARITIPRWLSASGWDAAAARADDVGRRFWALPTTVALTLLTLANLWVALAATGPAAAPLQLAVGLALAERAATFAYFIPTMVVLMRTADAPTARTRARRWARLNLLRLLLNAAAWLAALYAFSHG